MEVTGKAMSIVGAALVLIDAMDRWRKTTTVLDGGTPATDFAAVERRAKRRALLSAIGPLLVLVGSIFTLLT